jgi:hypothetical protein
MANGITVKDASAATQTLKTTDGGAPGHTPHHNIDAIAAGSTKIGSVNVRNNANDANIDPVAEATYTGRVGEVQASPTANTVLGRLKDLLTGIVLATGTNIVGAIKWAGVNWTVSDTTVASADASAGADLSAAPTAGLKIVIDDLLISVGAALTITVQEETTTTVIYKLYMAANTTVTFSPTNGRKLPSADKKIRIVASGAGNVFASCSYHSAA